MFRALCDVNIPATASLNLTKLSEVNYILTVFCCPRLTGTHHSQQRCVIGTVPVACGEIWRSLIS